MIGFTKLCILIWMPSKFPLIGRLADGEAAFLSVLGIYKNPRIFSHVPSHQVATANCLTLPYILSHPLLYWADGDRFIIKIQQWVMEICPLSILVTHMKSSLSHILLLKAPTGHGSPFSSCPHCRQSNKTKYFPWKEAKNNHYGGCTML